jgi:hypothetical protein
LRYYNVPLHKFKRVSDKTERPTLDARPFPSYNVVSKYLLKGKEQLDAIAVMAYGRNSEASWYAIADINAPNIVANRGDFSTIRQIVIPEF